MSGIFNLYTLLEMEVPVPRLEDDDKEEHSYYKYTPLISIKIHI